MFLSLTCCKSHAGRWLRAGLLVLGLALSGCANPPKEKPGDDGMASFGRQLRAPGPTGQSLGLSNESKSVERNLGYR